MMRKIMTACALALAAAFTWTTVAADAQQSAPQRSRTQSSGVNDRIEDYILVRLAEKAWVGGDFTVSVEDGRATLAGTVPSESTRARIGRIARQTSGVSEVRNDLRVSPASASTDSQVSDAELAQRVARRIASQISGAKTGEDWWFEGWRVEGPDNVWNFVVEAENGRVHLEGDVPRLSIMRQAIDAARQTAGVQSVRSDLEIDRVYRGYPYGPYGAYPYHPYAYGPHAYGDGSAYVVDVTPGAGSAKGSTLTGRVTSIDRERGRLTLQTDAGTTELPVPASMLDGVRQGQQVTVQLEFGEGAPSASPSGAQPEQRSQPAQRTQPEQRSQPDQTGTRK